MFIIMRRFIYSHEGLFSQLRQICKGGNMLCTKFPMWKSCCHGQNFPCETRLRVCCKFLSDKTGRVSFEALKGVLWESTRHSFWKCKSKNKSIINSCDMISHQETATLASLVYKRRDIRDLASTLVTDGYLFFANNSQITVIRSYKL